MIKQRVRELLCQIEQTGQIDGLIRLPGRTGFNAGLALISLICAACTPGNTDTQTLADKNTGLPAVAILYYRHGDLTDLSSHASADIINAAALDLVQSCSSQSKKRISSADWQSGRMADNTLELRLQGAVSVEMDRGSNLPMNALMIIPDSSAPEAGHVLTVHAGHYRSPYIICSIGQFRRLRALVEKAAADL